MKNTFEWHEPKPLQPSIKVNVYFNHKALPSTFTDSFWRTILGVKSNPTHFYFYGWLETDDAMGYLGSGDVIIVGDKYNDPNGVKLFINHLTSHNNKVRTYDVSSLTAIKPFDIRGKSIFKLYTVSPNQ